MISMSGRELAEAIKEGLKEETKGKNIGLAVILMGNDPASEKYVAIKQRECEKIGINFELHRFSATSKENEIIEKIESLNAEKNVTGIIVQLPLPKKFDQNNIIESILPQKDVDGLTSLNMGLLAKGQEGLFPATPEGVINLLRFYQVELVGKNVSIIGKSNLVGKPLALMMMNEGATVSVLNSKTENIEKFTLTSDIVISAVGLPKLISGKMIKKGAIVIDIGTTLVENRIVGDVDFETVSKKAFFVTPSPGGVGPMTVAMLLSNVVKASKIK